MGLFSKFKKKNVKEAEKRTATHILVQMMQQRIYSYPHSYFIQAAPKNFNFKGRQLMGLMRTCPQCGQTKPLHGGFRQNRDKKLYAPVCKECEAGNSQRIKELAEKTNLKSYIQKSWTKLCPKIDEKEMDLFIYNLKQIYYNQK